MSAFWHGRRTYEMMAAVWPAIAADAAAPALYADFARIWLDKPKLVFSRNLAEAGWNTTVMREVEKPEIDRLKARSAGDISVGGPTLAAELLRLGLVDELRMYVHPIVLGGGKPFLPPLPQPARLHLLEARTLTSEVVRLCYEVA